MLDFGTIAYFTGLTLLAFADPGSPLRQYDGALSSAWLALIAWTGLAVRRPFTLGIARRRTSPGFWNAPGFLRINVIITLAWTVSFTYAAIAGYVCDADHAGVLAEAADQVIGFGAPAYFTRWFSARTRARRTAGARPVCPVEPY
jgi:hypothetical protein